MLVKSSDVRAAATKGPGTWRLGLGDQVGSDRGRPEGEHLAQRGYLRRIIRSPATERGPIQYQGVDLGVGQDEAVVCE